LRGGDELLETTINLPKSWGIYVGMMSNWAKQFPSFSPLAPEEWDELKGHIDGDVDKQLDQGRLKELLAKIRDC
jgi:hypothetical protein